MTDIEKDIKEIKKAVEEIKNYLGIGKNPPASVIEINKWVEKTARKTKQKELTASN